MTPGSTDGRSAYEDNLTEGVGERIKPSAVASGGYRDHVARYLFVGHFVGGRTVVDLCCGNGYGSNLLHAAGAVGVTGIDIAADAVRTAREHHPGLTFEVGAADIPLDLGGYGVAVCFEGIEHVADPDQLLANMSAAGLAFVSSPNAAFFPGGFSGNPHHLREWTRREFEQVLSRHFSEVRMYFQWHYPDPVDVNRGRGALVKALVPVSWKRRLRSGAAGAAEPAATALPAAGDDRAYYGVHRATALDATRVLPGLRYGEPTNWLAVCRR